MKDLRGNKRHLLSMIQPGTKLVVIDTETTGFKETNQVIQFSGVIVQINDDYTTTELESIDQYIKPYNPLPQVIVEFNAKNNTGITDDFLFDKPTEDEVVDEIFNFMNKCSLHTGYNVAYDFKMLRGMSKRQGVDFDLTPSFDILSMARDFFTKGVDIENHKLETMTKHFCGSNSTGFHSAIADVRATVKVFEALLKMYIEYNEPKEKVKLIRAKVAYNELTGSNKTINLTLSVGKSGLVYYSVDEAKWKCKDQSFSEDIDFQDIESQFKKMYMNPHGYTSIEDVAMSWFNYAQKMKSRKK